MKKITFCIIISISMSVAFSANKKCCNKKAGKNPIACKFNQANIEENKSFKKELSPEFLDENQATYKCNATNKCNAANGKNQCSMDSKKPWWKFWAKKSINNCPCKQAQINDDTKKS